MDSERSAASRSCQGCQGSIPYEPFQFLGACLFEDLFSGGPPCSHLTQCAAQYEGQLLHAGNNPIFHKLFSHESQNNLSAVHEIMWKSFQYDGTKRRLQRRPFILNAQDPPAKCSRAVCILIGMKHSSEAIDQEPWVKGPAVEVGCFATGEKEGPVDNIIDTLFLCSRWAHLDGHCRKQPALRGAKHPVPFAIAALILGNVHAVTMPCCLHSRSPYSLGQLWNDSESASLGICCYVPLFIISWKLAKSSHGSSFFANEKADRSSNGKGSLNVCSMDNATDAPVLCNDQLVG